MIVVKYIWMRLRLAGLNIICAAVDLYLSFRRTVTAVYLYLAYLYWVNWRPNTWPRLLYAGIGHTDITLPVRLFMHHDRIGSPAALCRWLAAFDITSDTHPDQIVMLTAVNGQLVKSIYSLQEDVELQTMTEPDHIGRDIVGRTVN